jgi:hypothetical protein
VHVVAAFALAVLLRADPDAGAPVRLSPEAELEAELQKATESLPPAEVVVLVERPDPHKYKLVEATLLLDGVPLPPGAAVAPGGTAKGAPVSNGDHVLAAKLVYQGTPLGVRPWEEGPQWILPARVSLKATRGLRITLRLTVEANERAPVPGKKLSLRSEVEPVMMVAVEEPPPPPAPRPAVPEVAGPAPEPVAPAPAAAPPPGKPPPAKKKPAKKVARKPAPKAVPAAAATAAAIPASAGAAESNDGLEAATARLRAALGAPRDGGTPSR